MRRPEDLHAFTTWEKLVIFPTGILMILAIILLFAFFFSMVDLLSPWYEMIGISVIPLAGPMWRDIVRGLSVSLLFTLAFVYASDYVDRREWLPIWLRGLAAFAFYVLVFGWGWYLFGRAWYSGIAGAIVANSVLRALAVKRGK